MKNNKESKKTFTVPELAQAILDGKFKEGTKFMGDTDLEYELCMYNSDLCLYRNGKMVLSGVLMYRTFTLMEEPKPELFYFNQVNNNGKRIVDIAKQYDVTRQQIADLIRHNSEAILWEIKQGLEG